MKPKVSIIIPCQRITDYTRECVEHCHSLNYPDFEILVLPDLAPKTNLLGATIIFTNNIGPAEKRDIGAEHATGELLAFIDDDTYPEKNWLQNAVGHFQNSEVAAVAGPGITPPSDSLSQRAGGLVYSSFAGSGSKRYRYIPQEQAEVDDYPSCNLIVRKLVFQELGGFDTAFWPGEDTKFCLELTIKLKKKIIYVPKVLVYHHRRRLFVPHLKQIWSYAIHRGYFAKKFPQTSRRVFYFLPSLLLLGSSLGIPVAIFIPVLRIPYFTGLALYALIVLASSLQARELKVVPLVFTGIILTHLTYGLGFLKGLSTKELKR